MAGATGLALAQAMVATLPKGMDGLFNPWADRCPLDSVHNGPEEKLRRLGAHLDVQPSLILCGEAAGYQGKRHSGLAFTSERLLIEGVVPRVPVETRRLTSRELPFSEPSATIVWKTLYRLGIADRTVMWNALPMHPYRQGVPQSNRTPTDGELELGQAALRLLLAAFPGAAVVAVGQKALGLLSGMGVALASTVRHPANGGATLFASGLAQVVDRI